MVIHLSTFHLEGGAGVAATRLHRALLNTGVNSLMLIPSVEKPEYGVTSLATNDWERKIAWVRFVAERLCFYPHEKGPNVRFAFSPAKVGTDISEHPLVLAADVIHLHWINFGFLSMHTLDKLFSLGKPVVWTLHDMWAFTGGCHYSRGCDHYLTHCRQCPYLAKPGQYDISFEQFEQKAMLYKKTSITLVSPSRWLNNLVKCGSLTSTIASYSIPNCLDTNLFSPKERKQIRRQLNLPVDKVLILFAGANTQDPRKGFKYFKEAIRQLNEGSNKYEVLIFGKSNPDTFISFPAKVHYLGTITKPENMVAAYNAADTIVVPSLEDNLPNTIMEALSCGTPVVGFKTGGIPEMIDHEQNGYLAEVKSADSLTTGIRWVLEANQEGFVSLQARQKVLRFYTENIVARQYNDVYQSLMGSL